MISIDTFFNGRVRIRQSRSGYRFSIDAVLLASHARVTPNDTVVDLGTGCGIIPILLAHRKPAVSVYGVEIQQSLADLARLNVAENRMQDRVRILSIDMKTLTPDMIQGPADLIVSNPPYRKPGSGRINPDHQRAAARHELMVTLVDVVQTAHRLLDRSGRFLIIYPAERMAELICALGNTAIEPKMFRSVHSTASGEAKRILLEGVKGGRPGLKIAPPLIIYTEEGSYTKAVERMMSPSDPRGLE